MMEEEHWLACWYWLISCLVTKTSSDGFSLLVMLIGIWSSSNIVKKENLRVYFVLNNEQHYNRFKHRVETSVLVFFIKESLY